MNHRPKVLRDGDAIEIDLMPMVKFAVRATLMVVDTMDRVALWEGIRKNDAHQRVVQVIADFIATLSCQDRDMTPELLGQLIVQVHDEANRSPVTS